MTARNADIFSMTNTAAPCRGNHVSPMESLRRVGRVVDRVRLESGYPERDRRFESSTLRIFSSAYLAASCASGRAKSYIGDHGWFAQIIGTTG